MDYIDIIIIDDDSDDVKLFEEALSNSNLQYSLIAFYDIASAFVHLETKARRSEKLPDVIAMDLNLPRVNGHEALGLLKAHKSLYVIPVIVLTSSRRIEDTEKAYFLGASGSFVKPLKVDEWSPIMQMISELTEKKRKERKAV